MELDAEEVLEMKNISHFLILALVISMFLMGRKVDKLEEDKAMHIANWYLHDDLLKEIYGKDYGYASKYALVQLGNEIRWVRK